MKILDGYYFQQQRVKMQNYNSFRCGYYSKSVNTIPTERIDHNGKNKTISISFVVKKTSSVL